MINRQKVVVVEACIEEQHGKFFVKAYTPYQKSGHNDVTSQDTLLRNDSVI